MQAAIWSIPSVADFSPGEDGLSVAPALELQTRIDSSSYGDVKRFDCHRMLVVLLTDVKTGRSQLLKMDAAVSTVCYFPFVK